jgi:NAD kinase
MKDLKLPRVLLVTRPTQLEVLLERHGTLGQAAFFLRSRGQEIADLEAAHATFEAALRRVEAAIPADQRRTALSRSWLDRFVFAPDDLVLVVGQDGLVANAAKYLHGQLVIGINSDPRRFDGVLCRHRPEDTAALLAWTRDGGPIYRVQERAMALARRDDGLELLALNEIFVGHKSHQSARYRIFFRGHEERHSS